MPLYEATCLECHRKYEWLSVHVSEDTQPCPLCGGTGERIYSLSALKIFAPFCTRNIFPDGRQVEIKSQAQLSGLCNEFKLTHIDDPKAEMRHKAPPTLDEMLGERIMPTPEPAGDACAKEDTL